LYFSAYSSC